jgi:hypothetical protein
MLNICALSKPRSPIAPERQEAAHKPQPLQSAGFISALAVFSLKPGAEYGQMFTHVPQALQSGAEVYATVPAKWMVCFVKMVAALEAAAWACAMLSSIGLG